MLGTKTNCSNVSAAQPAQDLSSLGSDVTYLPALLIALLGDDKQFTKKNNCKYLVSYLKRS